MERPGGTAAGQAAIPTTAYIVADSAARLPMLAGQCFRDASGFARAVTALRLAADGYEHAPETPAWLPRLLDLEPYRVAFGHDLAVWQPDP